MATNIGYQDKPWLKSYQKGVPEHIKYEEICMPDILERTAAQFPKNDALIFQGYKLNFTQLKEMVDKFATCLTDFGVKKGDAVAILLPNMIPCVAAYFAILKIGAITVMNNPLYSDRELEYQFNDSGAKVLITIDLLGNRMIDLRPRTRIKQIVITSIGDYLPFPKSLLFPLVAKKKMLAADVKAAPDVYRWKELIAKYPANPPQVKLSFADVAMYQYTGGTTGVSKGVELTHSNLSKQVQQLSAWFPTFKKGEERALGALPIFHVFGMSCGMNFSIFMGWPQILVPKPQPDALLEAIKNFKPTVIALVPTMYIGLLNLPALKKTDISFIKGAFSGSAPLPVEVINNFEKITGGVIIEGFGLTETTPVTHNNPFADGARKVGSVGLPISDTLCRIVDLDEGKKDMPIGERGELIIKGPQVMKGYKDKPSETANMLRDGWIYTGDIATMDKDGYFYIVDRKKDMIITGGENVYSGEVEAVMFGHPAVREAAVFGVPDTQWGELVMACVVLKRDATLTTDELVAFCRRSLASYKVPKRVEFSETDLPKSSSGKVLKKTLRERYWKHQQRAVS